MLQICQLKFKYGNTMTLACGVQCRRCWRACNTILSQQQALAKQAQKHTACLEAHDQVQNYSCLSVGVCTLCLTPVLWINRIVTTNRNLWTNRSLLTSFLNSNEPRRTTTEEEHEQYDTFCTWKLHSWMRWVCKKLATHNSTKSSTKCFRSTSVLDQECPGNGRWLKPSSLPLVKLLQQGHAKFEPLMML